jgi:hypothetical protein
MPSRSRQPNPRGSRYGGFALVLLLLTGCAAGSAADRKGVRLIKVLPHYLDAQGRHTVNPSLIDRDVYQFELRQNPELRSGLRFDVLWRTWSPRSQESAPVTLRLELRGSKAPAQEPLVMTSALKARGGYSQWARVRLTEDTYHALGELVAWRVTVWEDENLLAEERSFLW